MKRTWCVVGVILLLLIPMPGFPSNLRTILIDNGVTNYPCDGALHWTPPILVYAPIAKAYLFFAMSPNPGGGLGGEAVLWANPFGQPQAALADVHLLHATPSTGVQGDQDRAFAPDRIQPIPGQPTEVSIGLICNTWPATGVSVAQVYAEVWVDTP